MVSTQIAMDCTQLGKNDLYGTSIDMYCSVLYCSQCVPPTQDGKEQTSNFKNLYLCLYHCHCYSMKKMSLLLLLLLLFVWLGLLLCWC